MDLGKVTSGVSSSGASTGASLLMMVKAKEQLETNGNELMKLMSTTASPAITGIGGKLDIMG